MSENKYPTQEEKTPLTVAELDAMFEKEDIRRLKEYILLSDTEKFKIFTRLMRIDKMLQQAKITHKKIVK